MRHGPCGASNCTHRPGERGGNVWSQVLGRVVQRAACFLGEVGSGCVRVCNMQGAGAGGGAVTGSGSMLLLKQYTHTMKGAFRKQVTSVAVSEGSSADHACCMLHTAAGSKWAKAVEAKRSVNASNVMARAASRSVARTVIE